MQIDSVIIRINMQDLLNNLQKWRDVLAQGSTMCPKEEFPIMAFICGFMQQRIPNVSDLFCLLEVLSYLKAEKKITTVAESQILIASYDYPQLYDSIATLLDKILERSDVDVLLELQAITNKDKTVKKEQVIIKNEPSNGVTDDVNRSLADNRTISGTVQFPDNTIDMGEQSDKTEKYDDEYFDKVQQANKESEAFARQLQEEQEKLAMAYRNNQDDEVMCEICFVGLYDEQFVPLEGCEHIFHKNCLNQFFKMQIADNKFPLMCPNDKCGIDLNDADIKQILDSELYKKYQKHTLKYYADLNGDSISWCPTADCEYMFFFEKDDDTRFQCPECKKNYCLNCRSDWHEGMTCKEYQITNTHSKADDDFMKFVTGKKFKQCPRCKFWVQKNQGCDHMTCKCKFQFCYKCGGVYGKCECVKKFQQEAERRRAQQLARAEKKLARAAKLKQKMQLKEKEKKESEPARPARGTRSRNKK